MPSKEKSVVALSSEELMSSFHELLLSCRGRDTGRTLTMLRVFEFRLKLPRGCPTSRLRFDLVAHISEGLVQYLYEIVGIPKKKELEHLAVLLVDCIHWICELWEICPDFYLAVASKAFIRKLGEIALQDGGTVA